jgi:hypothetical protein
MWLRADLCVLIIVWYRDVSLLTMTQQLQNLDEICSSTTKRFMQFESEYAWHGQAMRRKILMRILKRYKSIPQISELNNIEEDLSWGDFCLWYANRNKIVNQLELEFSDFVEDQREKEGRLFYRWHKSLFRAKEAYEASLEAQQMAQLANVHWGSESALDSASVAHTGPGAVPRKGPRTTSISAINSFRLADHSSSPGAQQPTTSLSTTPPPPQSSGADLDSNVNGKQGTSNHGAGWGTGMPPAGTGASTPEVHSNFVSAKERGGSADFIEPSGATGSGPASTVAPAPGATVPGGPSDGIIALKVTPFSIKAFIKYFANDVIGVQYGIPKDCMAANLALTEALFFR